jgi:crossover junction endodeoxyribonuclease RuvC
MNGRLRVLGVDPGTQYLGLGLVERQSGRNAHLGHFLLRPRDYPELSDRLNYIFDGIGEIIATHRPDAVAVEGIFHAKNARSAIILAHARGVALLCAARAGAKVFEYPPASVKRAVGVSGAAGKEAVQRMVCALLHVERIERADCADALAVAICHLNHTPLGERPPGGYTIVRR